MQKTPKLSIIIPLAKIQDIAEELQRLVLEISRLENLAEGLVQTIFVDNSRGFCLGHPLRQIVHNRLHNWIVVGSSPNSVSEARNKGIKQATGKYLTFVDADDGIEAAAYFNVLNLISSSQHIVDLVFMRYDAVINSQSINTIHEHKPYSSSSLEPMDKNKISNYAVKYIYAPRAQNPLTHCWSSLLRRDLVIDKNLKFHSKYNQLEDISFMCEMLYVSKYVYSCNVLAYHHNLYNPHRLSRQAFFPKDISEFVSKQTASVISLLTNEDERDIERLSSTMIANHLFMFYIRALSRSSVFDSQPTRRLYNQSSPIDQICDYYTPRLGETTMLPILLSRKVPHVFVRLAWWLRTNVL